MSSSSPLLTRRRQWLTLSVVALGVFATALDNSIVNVALPSIAVASAVSIVAAERRSPAPAVAAHVADHRRVRRGVCLARSASPRHGDARRVMGGVRRRLERTG
jgi:hypothetical protein